MNLPEADPIDPDSSAFLGKNIVIKLAQNGFIMKQREDDENKATNKI